jgi:hypothetical protein
MTDATPESVERALQTHYGVEADVWVTGDVVTIRLRGGSVAQSNILSSLRSNPNIRVTDVQKYEDWAGQRVVTFNVELSEI